MEVIKIKTFRNKTISSVISMLMISLFAVSIIATAGITNAQTTGTDFPTYPFIDAIPKTAGVGQSILVNFGLLNNLARDGDGWNVTAVITDPDGQVERITGMTWSTGTVGKNYVPTKEGDYTLKCVFERVYYVTGVTIVRSGWYAASESETVTLHVSGEGKPEYPGHAIPSDYWTRPIDGQLREWYSISGSWVVRPINRYAPYNDAPDSPHILWTQPIGDNIGGLAGGEFAFGYQDGDGYEGRFTGAIILSGILYYNKYQSGMPTQAIVAIDVHTGEKLWERSYTFANARITTGQILSWFSLNNRGAWAYIWLSNGTNMYALEAKTGDLVYNMTNVPSGRIYYGSNGELLKYQLVNYGTGADPDWYLLQWNSSRVVMGNATSQDGSWGSAVRGRSFNATERGYDLNVSIGAGTVLTGNLIYAFPMDRVVVGSTGNMPGVGQNITLSAISLKPGEAGRLLFKNVIWDAPNSFQDIQYESYRQSDWTAISQEDEVIVYWEKNTRVNYAFSLKTGGFLWKTAPQSYANSWMAGTLSVTEGGYGFGIIVYNKLYTASVGGEVYCYDINTGQTLWIYEATDEYTESYLTENWWLAPLIVSEGKIYFGVEEHSTLEPKPRGAPFFALDAETGDLVWEINGAFRQSQWGGHALIGDSVIITQDTYDQQIYAIGKGPSAMTVSAPDVGVAVNTPVMIKGTIMDVSPGTDSKNLQMRFPNGVPAVSDESMSEWMLYLYKQFERPTNTKGVLISIDAIDPNGNYVNLGTTTSDANGRFALEFTPKTEGQYTIYAIFEGSKSFYPTMAQNEMTTTAITAKEQNSNNLMYGLYIIGIVMIIVVLLVGLLILRKVKT
ncbi:MAG: PQQ-binding-like beta-propeller repeat protein [Nitrososphaerota archaeon]|jgi:hypothetical protein|nr:PQQ-binding-like beta-propeller repeat protein [Nitrososphaerota archaeon]